MAKSSSENASHQIKYHEYDIKKDADNLFARVCDTTAATHVHKQIADVFSILQKELSDEVILLEPSTSGIPQGVRH